MVGDDGSNTVAGGGGHDRLFGRGGDDILAGGDGNDGLYGDGGQDFLFGDAGNDLLWGGSGDDLLEGGAGADTLDGAEGEDTASYAGSKDGVVVNLATGIGSGGDAWGDTLTGIENLIGSARDDTLIGDAGANRLDGGAGQDWVTGGEGDDTFVFSGAWGHDDITDFGEGDIVELDAAAFARLDDVLANYIQNGIPHRAELRRRPVDHLPEHLDRPDLSRRLQACELRGVGLTLAATVPAWRCQCRPPRRTGWCRSSTGRCGRRRLRERTG
ncbi:MAG: calcium-binding protein [Hyphomicrobium sp.]